MKKYPSISRKVVYGSNLYVYEKLDGSNIRAEWTPKNGFHKFGRRNGLLDHSNPWLLEAPDLIMDESAAGLDEVFRKMRVRKAIAFFEFWGANSEYGTHTDEPHTCTLIDVGVDKNGLLPPKEFEKWFRPQYIPIAKLLQRGFSHEDMEAVRAGWFPGMPFEGVVVKGPVESPGRPLMYKVKSEKWLSRLREKCGDDTALFEKLR